MRKSKTHKAADIAAVLVSDPKALQDAMTSNQVPEPEPGNETAPDAQGRRRRRLGTKPLNGHVRPKAQDLPHMNGRGVERFTDKELDKIGDEFIEVRDEKAALATRLTAIETKAADRMTELKITRYEFSDQIMELKPGKTHVKVKTVKVEGAETEDDE